jgi:SP family sugar:H+ symporter-like MFS transporter
MPESPRFAYRQGKIDEARNTLARLNGLDPYSDFIDAEIAEIEEKLVAERSGGEHKWTEVFTGPRMLYRTLLGMILQAGQQLTGANFFFYYGTTIFKCTSLENSYVTSIILGSVNVLATVFGLWLVENCGRRKALIGGALWMFGCLLIYSLVGTYALPHDPHIAGSVLIVFTCLFICAFAATWGPLVWAIVGELYPARYRAPAMALATASNWLLNFLISFFTTFITNKIHYWYGIVFGGSCLALAFIVYFFVIESKDRSLEEIDTMYLAHVDPKSSASWKLSDPGPEGVTGLGTDRLHLVAGGQEINKGDAPGTASLVQQVITENMPVF